MSILLTPPVSYVNNIIRVYGHGKALSPAFSYSDKIPLSDPAG
jgi:hypothetical protein